MPFCCAHFIGWRNSGDSHQTSTKMPAFLWFALFFLPSVADGYLVGRLLSLQNVADAHRQLLEATTTGDRRALMQPPLVLMMPSPNGDGLEDLAENKRAGDFVPKKGVNVEEIEGDGINDYGNQEPISYAKKSLGLSASNGYMALNKFNGSGSRNCFFTPIQCMIQHDMGKYKKLVDSDIRLQLSG